MVQRGDRQTLVRLLSGSWLEKLVALFDRDEAALRSQELMIHAPGTEVSLVVP